MSDTPRILVIDDEESICFAFQRYFESRGFEVATAQTAREGLAAAQRFDPDVIFLDIRLPDGSGLDVLEELRRGLPGVYVVMITAYGSLDTVTRAVRGEAFDFLTKPIDLARALEAVSQAMASRAVPALAAAAETKGEREAGPVLVGQSSAMQEVFKRIGKVSQSDAAVLISGQTGTGKEVVARAIHAHSGRREGPFVAVNCGALPESLLESELFGYVRGAFTGADSDKPGRLEAADGGTVLLDEVGELTPAAQVKLLRVLDTQTAERLGSVEPIRLNVRVLAATNRRLEDEVAAGRFRQDLFYRLAVIQIAVPPLAERGSDIPLLAEHFLAELAGAGGPAALSEKAMAALVRFDWPGNVRELRNALEHATVVSGGGPILPAHLPESVRSGRSEVRDASPSPAELIRSYLDIAAVGEALQRRVVQPVERELLARVLRECDGNQSLAAQRLGLHRNTLRKKLREFGLSDRG